MARAAVTGAFESTILIRQWMPPRGPRPPARGHDRRRAHRQRL